MPAEGAVYFARRKVQSRNAVTKHEDKSDKRSRGSEHTSDLLCTVESAAPQSVNKESDDRRARTEMVLRNPYV